MTKKITWTMGGLAVLFAAALLVSGLPLAAQTGPGPLGPPDGRGMHRGEGMMENLAEMLDLTDEQRAEVEAIFAESPRGQDDEALRQARDELRAVIHDPTAGEEAVLDAVRAVSAESERVALARHSAVQQLHEILTAEQWQKLEEFWQQRPPRYGRGPHGRGRSGDGL